jgi:hypothetical protein
MKSDPTRIALPTLCEHLPKKWEGKVENNLERTI